MKVLPLAALCLAFALPARAETDGAFGRVIRIEPEAFTAKAGRITFSELPLGTRDPVFHPSTYGAAEAEGVLVGFGGFFEGQFLGTGCPPGTAMTGCVEGQPAAPLRLATRAPSTQIAEDGSNPHSPSLSGSPLFNGPISIVFARDVAGVGLAGGYFNTVGGTAIQAFDRQGRLIGGVRNVETGMEFMALVTSDGSETIAGLQFSLVGAEQAGFGIDDLAFASAEQIDRSQVEGLPPLDAAATPEEMTFEAPAPQQLMYRMAP